TVVFRAWDQTDIFGIGATGVNVSVNGGATAYSAATETGRVSVVELTINIAPVLDNSGTMTLPNIFEDAFTNAGETISNVLANAGGDRITDSNPGAVEGIAVISVATSNGNWQYSINGGASWNNFFGLSETTAVVLADSERLRFLPNGNFGGPSGPFAFRAWDRSDTHLSGDTGVAVTNNGGTSPFSVDVETADLLVVAMSDLNISKVPVGVVVPGTTITYRVTVTNVGPTHATNVVITDILPAEGVPTGTIITNIGTLFEGQSRSIFVTISVGPNFVGILTNVATVVHGGLDADLTDNGITNNALLVPSADLVLAKTCLPNPAKEGKPLTYTLTVSNRGPSAATGLVVTDALPAYVSFVSASAGSVHATGIVTRSFGTLLAGAKTSMTISVTVSNGAFGAVLTNRAWAASDVVELLTNNNAVVLQTPVVSGTAENDFDGDGQSDVGVVQPVTFRWTILKSSGSTVTQRFGFGTCVPVPGDYDGDGKWDLAVYDPVAAMWYIGKSSGGLIQSHFGFGGVTPVPADYDGDGRTDIAVFNPATGYWYIQRTTAGLLTTRFGHAQTLAVPADYDGDGKADIAIYERPTATWFINRSTAGMLITQCGFGSVTPVPCDYDGDGLADIAVYDGAGKKWYLLQTTAGLSIRNFGATGAIPLPADYDGDKVCDLGIYVPGSATWFLGQSTVGFETFVLGSPNSIPFTTVP
ncbi:MAG TPA: FG-GAP-like repeat-containing protein, partial [Kiritimatiellia bacterium]